MHFHVCIIHFLYQYYYLIFFMFEFIHLFVFSADWCPRVSSGGYALFFLVWDFFW